MIGDVFPRRNLGAGEQWGREVEERIVERELAQDALEQNASGMNRTAASNLASLGKQLAQLSDLYAAMPKTLQVVANTNGFGLSAGWNNICSASIPVPPGAVLANLLAVGSGQLVSNTTTGNIETSNRLTLVGVGSSPVYPGAWFPGSGDWRTIMTPSYAWTVGVSSISTLEVRIEANPVLASSYPANGNTYAVLAVVATFTG